VSLRPEPLDRFTCEETFARLDDFVDRELSPDEMRKVQQHLDACAACAAEHRFEHSVIQGVREKLRRIEAPADLLARISQRLPRPDG
jgi:mycothiol system anti-sigma-R factor